MPKATEESPIDDGNEKDFKRRLANYHKEQVKLRDEEQPNDLDENYREISNDYKVTSWVWNRLYNYQKTGVRWLLNLHEQYVGGILADEMGLGKTIQVSVFLRCIAESQQFSRIFEFSGLGPVLIVCPATLMSQWVKELSCWFPRCRVAIFHNTGSFTGSRKTLLKTMAVPRSNGSVLITSYTTYTNYHSDFKKIHWHYVILDEGHKIRNPDAKTTMALKELRTPHRLLLSGSPLQNNLKELWSLIDFIYPGRLGALREFNERFAIPITQGGYANATKLQVRVAYKCACLLRDAINPYMLQRFKKDVEQVLQLPGKSEQILFCDLTPYQRSLYMEYLKSKEIKSILVGRTDAFVGLINLRKLCNHPDLITGGPNRDGEFDDSTDLNMEFGAPCRSGKLIVMESLLKLWFKQKQKVLLFSQSRQMLSILETLVIMLGYKYLRMDGSTAVGARQKLVKRFNTDSDIFVFLLTTRVGGLGLNLTAANRVVIYDPDWNPSTDAQARERAWRIGQDRAVTIYRLMTSGTIEEKIYQRQIFKQFLANRILVDPKQKRFFKTKDLHELFTLADGSLDRKEGTETASVFPNKAAKINKKNFFDELAKKKEKKSKEQKKRAQNEEDEEDLSDVEMITLTDEYKEQLREKARLYVQLLADNQVVTTTLEQIENAQDEEPSASQPVKRVQPVAGEIEDDEFAFVQPTSSIIVDQPIEFDQEVEKSAEQDNKEDKTESKKSKKKHKKSRRRLLDGKFEIKYLRKQKTYREKKEENEEETEDKDQDDYVLKHLFKKAGVHSVLFHDKIVNESSGSRADMQLIEDEANAVASRAAEVLKRSQKQHRNFVEYACSSSTKKPVFGQKKTAFFLDKEEETTTRESSINNSTFTVLADDEDDDQLPEMFNGGMKKRRSNEGMNEPENSAALSSNQLSQIIKRRRYDQLEKLDVFEDKEEDLPPEIRMFPSLIPKQKTLDISLGDKYEKLAEEIRQFFIKKDARVTTDEVVQKFKSKVPTQDSFVFRSILRKIAAQLPGNIWALRDEYR